MENQVEHEICANCKKEIPQTNYVMHTVHCTKNITLCKSCNEPVPKNQLDKHAKECEKRKVKKPSPPPTTIEKSAYYSHRKSIEDQKATVRKERYMQKLDRLVDTGYTLKETKTAEKGAVKKEECSSSTPPPRKVQPNGLLACKYCDLELPKLDLDEHENYCGSRTDKCLDCGELVMFKYKQLHVDSNHGFLKLKDEPGPRPTWDSTAPRTPATAEPSSTRRRPPPLRSFTDFDYDPLPYMPSGYGSSATGAVKRDKGESYKDISRRLDCKTEYIRNLLHDSAKITVPLRHSGAVPRNHFNHNKGPAPQPPTSTRRRNPPTELVIPCEFCGVPVPHEDLVQHETGCRPDLARFNPRRRSFEDDDYFTAPQAPTSPEEELPCEFCADMIPASQLLRHQATCI